MMFHVKKKRRRYTEEDLREMQRLKALGLTQLEVAHEMGVPVGTIAGFLSERSRTAQNDALLRQLADEGLTRWEVMERTGWTDSSLTHRQQRTGIRLEDSRSKLLPRHREAIAALAAQGLTQAEIAERWGVCQASVSHYMGRQRIVPRARDLPPVRVWAQQDGAL